VPGDPVENFKKINTELELYSDALKNKYMAVAATKIDAADQGMLESLTAYCRENGHPFFPISAVSGAGLEPLLRFLSDRVEEQRESREVKTVDSIRESDAGGQESGVRGS
jgi:GTPase